MSTDLLDTVSTNHAREPVPESERVSGLRMAVIIVGIAITLPAFLIGSQTLAALGAVDGILAIGGAGIILAIIAGLTMTIAANTHLPTGQILIASFGRIGAKLVSFFIGVTLLGWFGFTVSLFADACYHASMAAFDASLPQWVYSVLGGLLMIGTTIFGFKAMDKLSRLAVPVLVLLLVWASYAILSDYSLPDIFSMQGSGAGPLAKIGAAMSALVGGFMVGVTISPDYARFARSKSDAATASVLSYGFGYQAVLIVAGLPALVIGSHDFVGNLAAIGLGVPAVIIVIFATWTTNVSNLYSTSLGFAQIFTTKREWLIPFVAGSVGTLGALLGIMDHFVSFLLFLGIAVPPVCGVFLADYYIVHRHGTYQDAVARAPAIAPAALIAWLGATGLTLWLDGQSISLTKIAAVDAILMSALLYVVFAKLMSSQRAVPSQL
ncbi:cytosine permease [Kordiimonas sediminis]|uniref:Cytosine permease n=1 Tax=Kordiimonas sediminis TaxID=1735581 RepID=A0A919E2S0_9PROT|nr:cytosine permease [Kordiimonas sediminis]GHF13583.1 cytosine permease [Kordiimonas sediminis]